MPTEIELTLKQTQQGVSYEVSFDESNANVLERFYTSAGNHVKEILLKLNLPDHRKLKDGGEVKESQRSFRHSDTEHLSRSDEVLKLKNFKKDATLKLFKSTNQESLMYKKFQMSSMRELTFFLGLQVKQKDNGIFISQDNIDKDKEAEDVDAHLYRSMIGSLMYLTASRPDIMFAVCACARFQVTPKTSHLHAVKRIFRYLKGQPKLGLWYPRDSPFDLEAFLDSDYAGASLDRKSTTRGCQFLGKRLISWQNRSDDVATNPDAEPAESSKGFFKSVIATTSQIVVAASPFNPDGVTVDPDAVSTH
ncbi:hypothetical protein Tco_0828590 [Tanacetum coccineum]